MKKLRSTALIILAAAVTAASMSGCGIIKKFFGTQPETVIQTIYVTESATTAPQTAAAQQTTAAPVTEAPETKAQTATEAPKAKYSTESNGEAVLVDGEQYHDSKLGITFNIPEWVGKVYAKAETNNGIYCLGFYEKTNYDFGLTKNWNGFGMLFNVYTAPEESMGDHIDYPAGSEIFGGSRTFLTYFKPTDVRFDPSLADNYQSVYSLQKDYFLSGVVDADRDYKPSTNKNALNLKSE